MNQYIIVGTLGQGAFGKVKLVLNSQDMNLYAVKLLSKGSLMRHERMRPRSANDYQAEAQRRMNVIRLLHHPNIICPFEVIGQHSYSACSCIFTKLSRVHVQSLVCSVLAQHRVRADRAFIRISWPCCQFGNLRVQLTPQSESDGRCI